MSNRIGNGTSLERQYQRMFNAFNEDRIRLKAYISGLDYPSFITHDMKLVEYNSKVPDFLREHRTNFDGMDLAELLDIFIQRVPPRFRDLFKAEQGALIAQGRLSNILGLTSWIVVDNRHRSDQTHFSELYLVEVRASRYTPPGREEYVFAVVQWMLHPVKPEMLNLALKGLGLDAHVNLLTGWDLSCEVSLEMPDHGTPLNISSDAPSCNPLTAPDRRGWLDGLIEGETATLIFSDVDYMKKVLAVLGSPEFVGTPHMFPASNSMVVPKPMIVRLRTAGLLFDIAADPSE